MVFEAISSIIVKLEMSKYIQFSNFKSLANSYWKFFVIQTASSNVYLIHIICIENWQKFGGFHIHLLVFPFVYQFTSRIGVLVNSSFEMTSSERFQQHFNIISKSVCCGFYMKKNVAFTLISFAVLK